MARLIVRKRFPWGVVLLTAGVCVVAVAAIIAGALAYQQLQQGMPIPEDIRKQVVSPVFLPTKDIVTNQSSYKFEPTQKILTFTGVMPDGQIVTFSEQPTPDPFNDIPNYSSQFLQKLYEYQAKDGLNGTIHLTHPKGAGQVVVLNSKGTLVFARVAHDEPTDIWIAAFNGLTIYQP